MTGNITQQAGKVFGVEGVANLKSRSPKADIAKRFPCLADAALVNAGPLLRFSGRVFDHLETFED